MRSCNIPLKMVDHAKGRLLIIVIGLTEGFGLWSSCERKRERECDTAPSACEAARRVVST
jgi:hypothetical protein